MCIFFIWYIIYSSSCIIISVCVCSYSSLGVVLFLCILISLCIFHLPDTSSYTKFSPFLGVQVIMLQNISVDFFWNITNELLELCRFLVFKCFCIFCNVRIWNSTCLHCVSVLCSVCIQLEAKIFLQVVIILASFHKIILSPPADFPALLKGYPWTLWLFHPNGQWLRPI